MTNIAIYVLNNDKSLSHSRMGSAENVITALDYDAKDFTLTRPPNTRDNYKWIENKWTLEGDSKA